MVLHSSSPMRPTPVPLTPIKHPRVLLRPGHVRASAVSSALKTRFVAKRTESTSVQQLQRPLVEYMSLPASQYSVLDAERIERIDENTFRCYVYRIKFFAFEVCPVLVVRVEEEPYGCCIRLLSCKLEGSPSVEAQNEKFSASMVNRISCNSYMRNSEMQQLTTDTAIEVTIEIPFAFRVIPVQVIESTGTQVLEQLLRIMLPRFLKQQRALSSNEAGCVKSLHSPASKLDSAMNWPSPRVQRCKISLAPLSLPSSVGSLGEVRMQKFPHQQVVRYEFREGLHKDLG